MLNSFKFNFNSFHFILLLLTCDGGCECSVFAK